MAGMVEDVENMTRNARELVLSQRTPTGVEDVRRIVEDHYKIEMGFTKEEWFCLQMPLIKRGKLYDCPADARKARIQAEEDT